MADDDEVHEQTSFDPTFAASGPRRSTFTPPVTPPTGPLTGASTGAPTGPPPTPPADPAVHDDDELANALAADLSRFGPPLPPAPEAPAAQEAAQATPVVPADPVAMPAAADPLPTAPWSLLPAPDPAQAVPLPDGPPQRPVRRSLPDDQLVDWVGDPGRRPGGTLDVIEQLESQLKLREQEAKEFTAWEQTMLSIGTPDAVEAVEQARPEFTGVLPTESAPVPLPPPAPVTGSFTIPETPLADWPAPDFGDVPLPLVAPTTPTGAVPVADPPPALPAWEVPAPSAGWSPPPEYGHEEPEPEREAEPAPEPEAEHAYDAAPQAEPEPEPAREAEPEPQAEIEPEPEPEPETASAPEPPPLVEPPPFGSVTSAAEPLREFSFEDLLSGTTEEPPVPVAPIFIEPMPLSAGEAPPTDTDSIAIVDQAYQEELADDVDETDRAVAALLGPVSVDAAGEALVSQPVLLPSGPISTVHIPADEVVLQTGRPERQRVFSLEGIGLEPTPVDHRVGRAARLFWLWFAANSSVLSLGLGATVFAVGMSLRQSIVSVLAGVALSFIPLGLTTLAGKRSGQPTMVVSRATFGLLGNVLPAILALATRLFWGAVLLWFLASSVAVVLVRASFNGPLGERQLLLIALAAGFFIALLIAFAGYPLVARIQLILSIVSGALVIGLIAMTYQYINIPAALTRPDGSWLLTVGGAVLVFSFVGLVWANSGADLARYQRPSSSGAASMLWATFGTTLPSFLLISYGALLAASNRGIASGFLLSPLDTLTLMLPPWYPIPLLAAATLSLLSGVVLSLYSGGFALQSIGVRVRRQWSIVIVGALLGGLAVLLTFGVTGGITELFRDVATTLAVPTAAWAGIFAAETMIRNRRFETQSLLRPGGVYPAVRWVNLLGLLAISAAGYGLTTATVSWLGWQGYLFPLLGVPLDGPLAASDLGVLVALGLGILLPLVTGIPAIRRQEAQRT